MHATKKELKPNSYCPSPCNSATKRSTSRKDSQLSIKTQNDQILNDNFSLPAIHSNHIGLQLKTPKQVQEMLKSREGTLNRRDLDKSLQKNEDIYNAYDILRKAFKDTNQQGQVGQKDMESVQVYKTMVQKGTDPKKNFFEFDTYFYKNYQANNNGPCTILPQGVINKVERFQEKLQHIIDES